MSKYIYNLLWSQSQNVKKADQSWLNFLFKTNTFVNWQKYIFLFMLLAKIRQSLVILPVNFLVGYNVSVNSRGKQNRRKDYGCKYRKYNMVVKF